MKINKLNYENYVIDYIEGTLSKELKKDFDLFLEKNGEVYEEIKDYISAPVLEETTEIFTEKKALKRSTVFNPYLLLVLIPLLLVGTYFLIPNENNQTTPELDIQPQELINQFAQEEITKPKQTTTTEIKTVKEIKKETKDKFSKEEPKRKVNKKKSNIIKNEYFAFNNATEPKIEEVIVSTPIVREEIAEVQTQVKLEHIAFLEAIPMKTFDNRATASFVNTGIASITPKDKSLLNQLAEKSSWLEMVTPASFNDINFKESLAIESNVNVNTSRKILNAFIPESLVK